MKKVLIGTNYTNDFSLSFVQAIHPCDEFYSIQRQDIDAPYLEAETHFASKNDFFKKLPKTCEITKIDPIKEDKIRIENKSAYADEGIIRLHINQDGSVDLTSFWDDTYNFEDHRRDPKWIAAFEKLGDKSTIYPNEIKLYCLPDDEYYYIDDYDGAESLIISKAPIKEATDDGFEEISHK